MAWLTGAIERGPQRKSWLRLSGRETRPQSCKSLFSLTINELDASLFFSNIYDMFHRINEVLCRSPGCIQLWWWRGQSPAVPSHVWSSGARSHRGVSSCNNFTQAADTDRQAESLHSLHITGQHENTANWSSQTHISRVQSLRQCGQRQQTLTSSAGDGTWSRDSHPV